MKPSLFVFLLSALLASASSRAQAEELRAGAAVVDVTPQQFPVFVNGGMLSRSIDTVKTKVKARAIVLDDGQQRLAIVVVDSCMMTRPFLDDVKNLASQRTKLSPDHILISATHTHSAPASMSCLGTDADPTYVPYLREKLAEVLAAAEANLEPAQFGWAVKNAAEFTALRRWILRPDRIADDPFGNPTVRANMHAGRNWDNVTGESGPEDPDLTMISLQSVSGRPIALLCNFSMHYFSGEKGLSADYYGLFCENLEQQLDANKGNGNKASKTAPPFVAMMSHGCSGDIWRRDYKVPADQQPNFTIDSFAAGLAKIALEAYASIEHRDTATLSMNEVRLHLKYRTPDKQRLEWAHRVLDAMDGKTLKTSQQVYAREQLILHERQATDVVVQAIRIGDIAIAATSNETYALTGLKLKLQSPLAKTMVIELANGGDGYIPPPEQHYLGGYNTWAARSAGLEVQAEPKIAAAALGLLESVASTPRRKYRQSQGPTTAAVLKAQPLAYWRLDEFAGPNARDSSGHDRDAIYEQGVVFFLAGPQKGVCKDGEENRAAHFAGGRLQTRLSNLGDHYTVSLWIWNGMPAAARDTAGWLFSRDVENRLSPYGDHLGIGGAATSPGKIIFQFGAKAKPLVGRTEIKRWTWSHLALVRDGEKVRIYLNGNAAPEIETTTAVAPTDLEKLFFGGRADNQANWEGRLDEIAVFNRALSAEEIKPLAGP